jgi:hypothetical protein
LRQHGDSKREQDSGKSGATSHSSYVNAGSPTKLRNFAL